MCDSEAEDSLEADRTESRRVMAKYFLLPPKFSEPV